MKTKTWSVADTAEIMGVKPSYVKECLKKKLLQSVNGRVTKDSVDAYFAHPLFTPEEAADTIGVSLEVMEASIETLIKHGLPTYQAWGKTHIRGEDLDKIDDLLESFLNPNKEKERQKKLQQEINTRHKWVANSQGNLCFICNKTFSKPPADWMSRTINGTLEVHAICEVCIKQQTKNN